MLTWKTVDPKAIYPLERYYAVSGNHEYRIFYGLKAASQDRPWVLVIREVGTACTRMCTIHHTADEAKKAAGNGKARHPEDDRKGGSCI